jgi:hypothetical protein
MRRGSGLDDHSSTSHTATTAPFPTGSRGRPVELGHAHSDRDAQGQGENGERGEVSPYGTELIDVFRMDPVKPQQHERVEDDGLAPHGQGDVGILRQDLLPRAGSGP